MTKVTFKLHPANTGLAAVGYSKQSIDLKILKKTFGTIYAPNWQTKDNKYDIGIMIIKPEADDNPNCNWKWIHFKPRFDTPEDAKTWIQDHIEAIQSKYTLRFSED